MRVGFLHDIGFAPFDATSGQRRELRGVRFPLLDSACDRDIRLAIPVIDRQDRYTGQVGDHQKYGELGGK
jgi:hypothetical protein